MTTNADDAIAIAEAITEDPDSRDEGLALLCDLLEESGNEATAEEIRQIAEECRGAIQEAEEIRQTVEDDATPTVAERISADWIRGDAIAEREEAEFYLRRLVHYATTLLTPREIRIARTVLINQVVQRYQQRDGRLFIRRSPLFPNSEGE